MGLRQVQSKKQWIHVSHMESLFPVFLLFSLVRTKIANVKVEWPTDKDLVQPKEEFSGRIQLNHGSDPLQCKNARLQTNQMSR